MLHTVRTMLFLGTLIAGVHHHDMLVDRQQCGRSCKSIELSKQGRQLVTVLVLLTCLARLSANNGPVWVKVQNLMQASCLGSSEHIDNGSLVTLSSNTMWQTNNSLLVISAFDCRDAVQSPLYTQYYNLLSAWTGPLLSTPAQHCILLCHVLIWSELTHGQEL